MSVLLLLGISMWLGVNAGKLLSDQLDSTNEAKKLAAVIAGQTQLPK